MPIGVFEGADLSLLDEGLAVTAGASHSDFAGTEEA